MSHIRNALARAALVLLVACGSSIDVEKTGTQAVVIGIDRADWRIIEALAAEGEMRNLMGLRERGT